MKSGWTGRAALPAAGIAIIGLTLLGLSLHVPHADSVGSPGRTNGFIAIAVCAGAVYLGACAAVLRQKPTRGAIWLVLAVALAIRVPALVAPPFLSSDLYRYIWDGRVQHAGINPYRYIPADPALRHLRDAAIYPHINRRDYAPTIYPPMSQVIFRAVTSFSQSVWAMKIAMVGFEGIAVGCLIALLRIAGLPTARVLIYAWNPLAVWAFAGNGHVDAASAGLVAAALLCRGLRRDGLVGAFLGAATLVKFLPLAIAPALWRPGRWRAPLAGICTIAALYACYIDVGPRVLGFLSTYGSEEGISQGGGVWILAGIAEFVSLPQWAGRIYMLLCATGLVVASALMIARNRTNLPVRDDMIRVCAQAGGIAAAFMIVLSPHYSWYFPYLAVFATIAPVRAVIWLSVSALLLDLDPFHDDFVWRALIYVPAIALAIRDIRGQRANVRSGDQERLIGRRIVLEQDVAVIPTK